MSSFLVLYTQSIDLPFDYGPVDLDIILSSKSKWNSHLESVFCFMCSLTKLVTPSFYVCGNHAFFYFYFELHVRIDESPAL